jgi:hypothetical protein
MTTNRIAIVKSIGAAEVKTEKAAAEIVASVPAEYDWKARGAVPQAIIAWCGGSDEPQKRGPKGDQVTTNFGKGVDRLRQAVSKLVKEDRPKPIRLAVTMSGEGAPTTGTVTIDPTDPLYAVLVGRLMDSAEESAAA